MNQFLDFLKIILPAAMVLYGMYLTTTSFLNKNFEGRLVDVKINNAATVLPLRLQAYERIVLFLERITPNNLLLRLNNPTYSAKEFHQVLLREIREELNHNLSQQVYIGDKAWLLVKKSVEDLVMVINNSSSDLPSEASGLDLAKKVFESLINNNLDLTSGAIFALKEEIRKMF